MTNPTQASQQVPVAMTDEQIARLASRYLGIDFDRLPQGIYPFARALLAQSAAAATEDAIDAARWRETLQHVGATTNYPSPCQQFTLRYLKPVEGTNLMRGGVAGHFAAAIDAALAKGIAHE